MTNAACAIAVEMLESSEDEQLLELARSDGATPVDLLNEAIERSRPMLANRKLPIADRLTVFWAVAKHASSLCACDVHEAEFLRLASETGLTADLGRHADDDLRHVISWAWRGMNPFAEGPLE